MSAVSIQLDSIPASLKQQRRWVLWRYEDRDGKKTKVPYSPHLGPADERFNRGRSNDPRTWGTFADVCRHLRHMDGVGFMLGDGFCGVDLDKVRDPESGEFLPLAKKVIAKLDTYAEVSPSRTGVKLLALATKPDGRCVWTGWPSYDGEMAGRIEIYSGGRFFTVTGCHVEGTPDEVQPRQDEIDLLCGGLGGEQTRKTSPSEVAPQTTQAPDSSDEDIVRQAGNGPAGERFVRLWMGDTSDYDGDESRADLALCSLLAPLTGPDPERIDRLFRQSRLYRDKWDRPDYQKRTIEKAVTGAEQKHASAAARQRPSAQPKGSDRHADQLVAFGRRCELWHDPLNNGHATMPGGGNFCVFSSDFRRWLVNEYVGKFGRAASRSAVEEAVTTLDALAVHRGPRQQTYLRVARSQDAISIDLGDATWDAVIVTADGWRVGPPPVKFVRSGSFGLLPRPQEGGSIDLLRKYVNVAPEDFPLVAGSILDALKGEGPYLATVVVGEQGAAKSTLCRVIRKLIDPAPEGVDDLSDVPRDARELGIDGHNNFVLAYDNISKLPAWLSDAFCRVATGGSIKARKLYADSEQMIFSFCRPLLLNGISEFATASDLLSRAVLLHAEWIPDEDRMDERDFWGQFDRDRPAILGVLYEALASGLRSYKTIRLAHKPRMAGTATWVAATFPALGWSYEDWETPYSASQQTANDISLETSPVGTAIFKWWQTDNAFQTWEGTASELRDLARPHCEEQQARYWPLNGKTFADRLKRVIPSLRSRGVQVESRRTKNARLIMLSPFAVGDAEVTQVTQHGQPVTQPEVRQTPNNGSSGGRSGERGYPEVTQVTQGDAAVPACVTANSGREVEQNLRNDNDLRPVVADMGDAGDAGDATSSVPSEKGARKPQSVDCVVPEGKAQESASPASPGRTPGLLGVARRAGDVVLLPGLPVPARLVGYFPGSREWTVEVDVGAINNDDLPPRWQQALYQLGEFRQCRPELWRAGVTPEGSPTPSLYPRTMASGRGCRHSAEEAA